MKNLFTNVFFSVCFLFLFGANNSVYAQSAEAEFLIVIKSTDKGVDLNCIRGCDFKELSLSLNGDKSQAINNAGMTHVESDFSSKSPDDHPSDYFLFTLEKNDKIISLKGIHGTYWKTLEIEYNPNLTHIFNQNGHVY